MDTGHRVAIFFVLLGIFLLVMFVFSDIARMTDVEMGFLGVAALVAGMIIWALHPVERTTESRRFRLLKRRKEKNQPKKPS